MPLPLLNADLHGDVLPPHGPFAANFCAFVDQHGFGAVVIPLTAVGKGRPQPMPAVRVGAEVRTQACYDRIHTADLRDIF